MNEPDTIVAAAPRRELQTAAADAIVQRTLGEVQVAVMMAKRFPRDKIEAKEKLVNDCCRESLAKVSMYSYARGGTNITGPSIRLAEAAKNAWGNMQSGWREISRSMVQGLGMSEIECFAWDAENNTRASVTFTVKHWRDTKQGGYAIKEERDIYELCANQAARRERACILKMIDGDMIEAAIAQCNTTLETKVQVTPERITSMLKAFLDEYGVTQEQVEKRIQRRVDAINPPLLISLTKIYNSMKDGMSKAGDWFEAEEKPDPEKPTKGAEAVKEKLKEKKAKAAGADTQTGEIKPPAKMRRSPDLHPGEDPGIEEEKEPEKTPAIMHSTIAAKIAGDFSEAATISDLAMIRHINREFIAETSAKWHNHCADAYNDRMTELGGHAGQMMEKRNG